MSNNLLKRFEVLVSTGSPGLYRVVAFFFVERIFSLSDLGKAASSMSGAQIASYATAVGWLTLALVRLPAVSTRREAVDTFYRFLSMSFLTCLVVSVLAVCTSKLNLLTFELSGFLWQLWGWTAYQMGRHYFVAFKRYRTTIMLDVLLIVLTIATLRAFHHFGWSPANALGLVLAVVGSVMFVLIGVPTSFRDLTEFESKGLEFGFTNLLSGGISLVIVPTTERLCGASFAGLLSLLTSITAVGALLPRAVSLSQLPELARLKRKRKNISDVVRKMKREIAMSNFGTLVVSLGLVFAIVIWKVTGEHQRYSALAAGALLCVQCSVGAMGTVNSNVMMVFERSKQSVKINLKSSIVFLLFVSGALYCGGEVGLAILMSGAVLVTVARNLMTRSDAQRVSEEYLKSNCATVTQTDKLI